MLPHVRREHAVGIELLWSPVVEKEEIDARKSAQELRVSSVAAGECKSADGRTTSK
jgi:hypothetical protein